MFQKSSSKAAFFFLLSAALVHGPAAFAGLEVVSQSVCVDREAEQALFEVIFSEPPDFWSTDTSGRQVEGFQYEIDCDWKDGGAEQISYSAVDAVIRGGEIHVSGDVLRIRNARGRGGVNADGWGRIRKKIPFELQGRELSFTTDLDAIGDDDGIFAYRLLAMSEGIATSVVEDTSALAGPAAIPLPVALWSGLSLMGGLVLIRKNYMTKPETRITNQ